MSVSLRGLRQALTLSVALAVFGCAGADDPKIPEGPAFVPTEAEKAVPKNKPAGYGEGKLYKETMNKSE